MAQIFMFFGGAGKLARANIGLRMGERVMILLARFPARSFEELYQGVKAIPLERFVPREGAFPVKGYSLDSQLHSVPDCQSIVKKAAVDHLGAHYGLTWLPETGETYQLRFSIMKDLCEVFLDSSGVSLHKRGYRAVGNEAPLHETMAAAMVNLARYRGRDFLLGPVLRLRHHRYRGGAGRAEPRAGPCPQICGAELVLHSGGCLDAGPRGRARGGVPRGIPHSRHGHRLRQPCHRHCERKEGRGKQIHRVPRGGLHP